ncbi:MAG: efflux RND transporter permease subunit, partial [Polaromonas sp.]|nr:efflux RND transporter permease subunit [Polaromonas sp.]
MNDHTPSGSTGLGASGRMAAAFQSNAITPLLALMALLLGLFAVLVTPREEEPQINVTMANVLIPFPGASSENVQNMVARPAEQVLSQIADIEHTYSVARPGLAVLTVQFKVGVPRTEALVRLYDVLNANQDWLPRDLGTLAPIVKPKGIDDVPVLAVTLWSGDALAANDLERVARTLEMELKRVPGTREVQTIGGPGRAVHVWLDPVRLRERGVDVLGLKQTLAAANFGMPSGSVMDPSGPIPQMLSVETGEFLSSAEEIGSLVVGVSNGKPVYLSEVARIEAGAQLPQRYVWFTPGAAVTDAAPTTAAPPAAGQVYPAVTLTVTKKPGENAVDVARAANARLEELRNTVIPANIQTTVTRDYGETAAEKANKLIQKLAFATGSVLDPSGPTPQMLTVETGEFLSSAEEIGSLVVGVSNGKPVYLSEVARIEAGAQLPQRYVWFTPGAAVTDAAPTAAAPPAAGQVYPAVTLTVTKKPGENAVDVARAANARLEELRNTVIPANIQTTVTRDYGETAAEKANKLIQKLAFATGSVILLVGFALGRREAVIVGAAVILTLMATLFASWAWGFTLNRVSLFALIFSIGILVDDAIVVVENIHRHQQLFPEKSLADIIPAAVDEVGGPTILATLTVIAALLPMAFVSGLMGPYMSPIPINSSLGMAISLAIAFTVTPWLALKLMKTHGPGHGHEGTAKPGGLGPKLERFFTRILTPLLDSARKRWLLLAGILVALLLSVGLTMVQW